jgi:hypothetical protein
MDWLNQLDPAGLERVLNKKRLAGLPGADGLGWCQRSLNQTRSEDPRHIASNELSSPAATSQSHPSPQPSIRSSFRYRQSRTTREP